MNYIKSILRAIVAMFVICGPGLAHAAGPTGCASGYQDNTCISKISNAAETAPTCSTGAGWITLSPATWIGSGYSAPSCSYTPPTTCPAGTDETTPPTWNGSQWVGIGCTDPTPPAPVCTYVAGNTYVEIVIDQGVEFSRAPATFYYYLVVNGGTLWQSGLHTTIYSTSELNNALSPYGYSLGTLESTVAPNSSPGGANYFYQACSGS